MVSYLGQRTELFNTPGATIKDLRSLLTHPSPPTSQADSPAGSPTGRPGCHVTSDSEAKSGVDDDAQMEQEDEEELPSSSTLNEDFHYLDLTWSMGRSISVREVSDLLFPRQPARARSANASGVGWKDTDVLESWDAPEGLLSPPRPLLPNLTHLSLALFPSSDKAPAVSWRHLLSFAKNLPMLTHLSLAYWPEPTLTPNAKLATVTSPMGQRLQYGGTGAYSHSLDNDWAEAVLLMRKLSKALYGLEYLDLTGCASWLPALMRKVDNGQVDWVGDWGKITKLVLNYGVSTDVPAPEEAQQTTGSATVSGSEMIRQINATSEARLIEAYIRQQRAGRGRFITVVYDRRDTAGSNVS
ncbi:hypothetical protein SEUCBS139899_000063 [Sporothrix eucalyptigena]|uniref:Tafazzin n=1 Tax=Sporothrix eucalyptigena TaxID=1812306 RepID=A0ABP0ARI5_9PEZI